MDRVLGRDRWVVGYGGIRVSFIVYLVGFEF